MASDDKMCPTYSEKSLRSAESTVNDPWEGHGTIDVREGKRVRVKCPTCGRRVWGRLYVCNDGCCVMWTLPRHKIKGWWKKSRKASKHVRPGAKTEWTWRELALERGWAATSGPDRMHDKKYKWGKGNWKRKRKM